MSTAGRTDRLRKARSIPTPHHPQLDHRRPSQVNSVAPIDGSSDDDGERKDLGDLRQEQGQEEEESCEPLVDNASPNPLLSPQDPESGEAVCETPKPEDQEVKMNLSDIHKKGSAVLDLRIAFECRAGKTVQVNMRDRWNTASPESTTSDLSSEKGNKRPLIFTIKISSLTMASTADEMKGDDFLIVDESNRFKWLFLLSMITSAKKNGETTVLANMSMLRFFSYYGIRSWKVNDSQGRTYLIAILDTSTANAVLERIRDSVELTNQLGDLIGDHFFPADMSVGPAAFEEGCRSRFLMIGLGNVLRGSMTLSSPGNNVYVFTPKKGVTYSTVTTAELARIGQQISFGPENCQRSWSGVIEIEVESKMSTKDTATKIHAAIQLWETATGSILLKFLKRTQKNIDFVYVTWLEDLSHSIDPHQDQLVSFRYGVYAVQATTMANHHHKIYPHDLAEFLVDLAWELSGNVNATTLTGKDKATYVASRVKAAVSPLGDIVSWDELTVDLPVTAMLVVSALSDRVCLQYSIKLVDLTSDFDITHRIPPNEPLPDTINRNIDVTYVSLPFAEMHSNYTRICKVIADAEHAVSNYIKPRAKIVGLGLTDEQRIMKKVLQSRP